jgi:hypothetical protein
MTKAAYARPVHVKSGQPAQSLDVMKTGGKTFSEQWLQKLIHEHPTCLPVAEIEPGFGDLVSICMELQTPHGPIDNLLMTPQGDIVLVEAKLWHNHEARRQVVAQALDYASCMFEWDFEALEKAALKADWGERPKPKRLYDLFDCEEPPAEPAFIDAVNANLRAGRVLILVVGDGIRTEARKLGSLLQSHAGAHFTFAMVELSVFRLDGEGSVIVCPRILTQTEMIERGIVRIEDRRVSVVPMAETATIGKTAAPAENITAKQFYDAMDHLQQGLGERVRAFVANLDQMGIEADFQRALNLRWEPPSGRPINLGTIHRNGQVWTDAVNAHAPHDLSHQYVEELAKAFGMDVEKEAFKGAWHVRDNGHAPRIGDIANQLDAWSAVIEKFITRVKDYIAETS